MPGYQDCCQIGGGKGLENPLWLVTLFGRWGARSATEATVEPPVTVSPNQGAKSLDEMGGLLSGRGMGPRGVPHR